MTFPRIKLRKTLIGIALVLAAAVSFSLVEPPLAAPETDEFDQNRARLLSYVLRRQVDNHYSGKEINNDLSKAAFHLYLKQLDYQKRFLLKSEVAELRKFELHIDDEFLSGRITLSPLGQRLSANGIERARGIVKEIMAKPFDFTLDESYETDPEKLDFCTSVADLKERWRKELKAQTLNRYLTLMEEADYDAPDKVEAEKHLELEQDAREKVLKSHNEYFGRLEKETSQDHYDRYLNAFVRAFDPHSSYMAPRAKEDFDIGMRGSLEGIGATLREEGGYIKVVKVIPGSAADRQGQLHADDVILAVAQGKDEAVDVTDMRLRDAVALIRGKKGTEVRLTIKRAGSKSFVIPIIRDVVIIEESFVKFASVTDELSGQKYGYIKIPSFYRDFEETRNGGNGRNSTDDVKAALQSFKGQGINGLILDLRNNGGGALTDAVGVAGLFIRSGPIVQVRTGSGQKKVLEDQDASIEYEGPMVVLVNQFSASASEIVAAALQDYNRAVILGSEHTHGKGSVQVIMDLDRSMTLRNMKKYQPLGALKLTTQMFYRINGDSTQYRGVEPDIVLPDRRQYNEFGEKHLDYSLPFDAIASVSHSDWREPPENLEQLAVRSQQRVKESDDFKKITKMAEAFGERLENTVQPLSIDKVYAEWNKKLDAVDEESAHGSTEKPKVDDAELTAEENLVKRVSEDPYAKEAMAVLAELNGKGVAIAEQRTGPPLN